MSKWERDDATGILRVVSVELKQVGIWRDEEGLPHPLIGNELVRKIFELHPDGQSGWREEHVGYY